MEYLLSVGANIELRDEDGDTPLLVCETPAIFQRLVAAGANPNAKNTAGRGILNKAVEDDNEELILYLQANGYITDPNFKYTPGESELENLMDMLERVSEDGEEGVDGDDDEGEEDGGAGGEEKEGNADAEEDNSEDVTMKGTAD